MARPNTYRDYHRRDGQQHRPRPPRKRRYWLLGLVLSGLLFVLPLVRPFAVLKICQDMITNTTKRTQERIKAKQKAL